MNKENLFYIVEKGHGGRALFWRSKGSGHTIEIDEAGKFTESSIRKRGTIFGNSAMWVLPVDAIGEHVPVVKTVDFLDVKNHVMSIRRVSIDE